MVWILKKINLMITREAKLSDTVVVYWSPWQHKDIYDERYPYYQDPEKLLSYVNNFRNNDNSTDTWYKCRGFMETARNTFVLRSPFGVDAKVDAPYIRSLNTEYNVEQFDAKNPSMSNSHTVNFSVNWIFWSEEDLSITTISPYVEPLKFNGFYVPGSFNINKWFRPVEGAFQLFPGEDRFAVDPGDPIIYIKFNTDKKVILKRFKMNDALHESVYKCTTHKIDNPWQNLPTLYSLFTKNKWGDIIRKNILENMEEDES